MTSLAYARGLAINGRLSPTDLGFDRGEMVAVIGPNGGGKTSLLRAMARTEDANGEVAIEGVDVDSTAEAQRRRLLAYLPASREVNWPVLLPDYLAFGLGSPDPAQIQPLLDLLELAPLAHRSIDRLSTGERARAMLGRALAGRARLLLLDEPLSNLDPYWALRTVEIIRAEIEANTSAALISVHDLDMVRHFDRALLVTGGNVIADGMPTEVLESRAFGDAFRICRRDGDWAISTPEGRQSSP